MKERLDLLLVERRLTESRTKAQWLIRNGYVLVNGKKILKPGKRIENSLDIHLIQEFPYVGRGGIKLESALKEFSLSVKNKTCADIGASIGGFTDCLIKFGAFKVYAVDTATDLLHPSLTCEKMKSIVIPLLGIDARNLTRLEELVDICTIDITFTSMKEILPKIKNILKKNSDIIVLIKPLFETNFYMNEKLNIIQDPKKLESILEDLLSWCIKNEFFPQDIIKSPILGKRGSIEFLLHLKLEKSNLIFDYQQKVKELLNSRKE